jgi:hypothetical protein
MSRRVLIASVVGLHASAAAVCLGLMLSGHRPPGEIGAVVVLAILLAQGSLLAIWAAFGGRATPWRFAGVVATLAVATLLLKKLTSSSALDPQTWGYFMLANMIGTSAPCLLLRFLGLQVVRPLAQDSGAVPYRFQFSLRSLLEWTAAVAVLCSMLQIMPADFRQEFTGARWYRMVIVFAVAGLVSVVWLWVALGARWLALRLALLALTLAAVTTLILMTHPPSILFIVALVASHAGCLFGTFLAVRTLGCRLLWRPPMPMQGSACVPVAPAEPEPACPGDSGP